MEKINEANNIHIIRFFITSSQIIANPNILLRIPNKTIGFAQNKLTKNGNSTVMVAI